MLKFYFALKVGEDVSAFVNIDEWHLNDKKSSGLDTSDERLQGRRILTTYAIDNCIDFLCSGNSSCQSFNFWQSFTDSNTGNDDTDHHQDNSSVAEFFLPDKGYPIPQAKGGR